MKLLIISILVTLLVVYTGAEENSEQQKTIPEHKHQYDNPKMNFKEIIEDWIESAKGTVEKIESSKVVTEVKRVYDITMDYLEDAYDKTIGKLWSKWKSLTG